jgi:hypothetical protein
LNTSSSTGSASVPTVRLPVRHVEPARPRALQRASDGARRSPTEARSRRYRRVSGTEHARRGSAIAGFSGRRNGTSRRKSERQLRRAGPRACDSAIEADTRGLVPDQTASDQERSYAYTSGTLCSSGSRACPADLTTTGSSSNSKLLMPQTHGRAFSVELNKSRVASSSC